MFDVKVDGKELMQLIKRFERAGNDMTPFMGVISEQLTAEVNDMFESAGHGKWSNSLVDGRPIFLKRSGVLAASVYGLATDHTAEAATGVSYAVYHCSSAPRKKIPLRDPFDIPDEAFDRANETLLGLLMEALGK